MAMAQDAKTSFLRQVNPNLGIAKKICRIYFSNAEEREDALQEMMYQLWRSYLTFDNRSKFSTWMYRVCLNTALTYRRKRARQAMEFLSGKHHEIAEGPPINNEERNNLLYEAIATLSPVNKAVILLYLEEMSYEEIATITGFTRSNVSVRLVRIKKELETILKTKANAIENGKL